MTLLSRLENQMQIVKKKREEKVKEICVRLRQIKREIESERWIDRECLREKQREERKGKIKTKKIEKELDRGKGKRN